MGANNVIPTVPTFISGSPSIAQLNQLAYAASFLSDYDVRPEWCVFMYNGTQSVPATTWTQIAFDHVAYDSDGVTTAGSKSQPQIVTQGYYEFGACVSIECTSSTSDAYTAAFQLTTGANNPHYTTGTVVLFGFRGLKMSSTAQAAADNAVCLSAKSPNVLYPGDKLAVAIWLTAAKTVDFNQNTSFIQGRFATKFTGRFLRTGT